MTHPVHVTMGMGMATFSCLPKFPSIGRLNANAMSDSGILYVENNTTLTVYEILSRYCETETVELLHLSIYRRLISVIG